MSPTGNDDDDADYDDADGDADDDGDGADDDHADDDDNVDGYAENTMTMALVMPIVMLLVRGYGCGRG